MYSPKENFKSHPPQNFITSFEESPLFKAPSSFDSAGVFLSPSELGITVKTPQS